MKVLVVRWQDTNEEVGRMPLEPPPARLTQWIEGLTRIYGGVSAKTEEDPDFLDVLGLYEKY